MSVKPEELSRAVAPLDPGHRPHRVAVTGVGIVSPLGRTADAHWTRLLAGDRAVRDLPELRPDSPDWAQGPATAQNLDWTCWSGAPACGFPVCPGPRILEEMSLMAAADALAGARLPSLDEFHPGRLGCVLGVSKPALPAAPLDPNATDWIRSVLGLSDPALAVASTYGLAGPALSPSAACATGLVSLIRGADLIRDGECDLVLAGSSDWSLSPDYLASYRRLGVLAQDRQSAAAACRPFDLRRRGFAVGSGAAVLVLEEWSRALKRGAEIYAEWLGSALAGDGMSMVDVDSAGHTPARVIADALSRSGLFPEDLQVASLHGTGTRANDLCESRALRLALGTAAGRISCFSVKGSMGHLMGAAGSIETATLALSLRAQIVPPTMNLELADPACDLDYTPLVPRARPLSGALKLSLGFGGACAAAVLRCPA